MLDKPHDECGVFGIFNKNGNDLAHEIYLALYALQHRGQLSCGIAVNHGKGKVNVFRGEGLVPEVFNDDCLSKLSAGDNESTSGGIAGIGHVRYSPKEFAEQANTQPLVMRYARGVIAIANNGCLINSNELRRDLEMQGAIFQTSSDAELIGYLIARQRLRTECVEDAISNVMNDIVGAYSFVLLSPKKLVAVRDPQGFRPLCIGMLNGSYVVASESCAIQSIGGEFLRDIEPGEIVVISKDGLRSLQNHCGKQSSLCIFEHVYFARPDSIIDGAGVHNSRLSAGAQLASEYPVQADVVIGVPDSGLDAAIGYSEYSGIPYEIGFIKNRYIGRTLIQNSQLQREKSVYIKLNPVISTVKGKRVVLVDDSIVRGTTSAHIVDLLRKAGAAEVHMRISSPPFLNPCYFGTDISSRDYLIACNMSKEKICEQIGADSLGYLSFEGLFKIAKESKVGFCYGCFTGEYPLPIEGEKQTDKFAVKLQKI